MIAGLFTAWTAFAQVTPRHPLISDSITVTYRSPQAAQVYTRITVSLNNGAYQKFHVPLQNGSAKFLLPPKAASFKTEVYTLNKDDARAAQETLVYGANGQPVAGAYFNALFDEHPDSILAKELANYPHNYLAYAKFFNVDAMMKDQQTSVPQIKALLQQLKVVPEAGCLAAFCVGMAKTAQLPGAKQYLYQLFDRFPESQEAAFAFSIYNYEYYKASRQDVEADVRERLKLIFLQYPHAPISGDNNVVQFLMKDESIPVSAFEQVLLPQYANYTLEYFQLSTLPEIYISRRQNLKRADSLLKAAITLFQEGTINHQYRLDNSRYQLYVPVFYLDLARSALLQRHWQDAVTYASAGMNLITGANTEGNFMPLLLAARAEGYENGGNLNLALEDQKRLYLAGDTTAKATMQRLFPLCEVKQRTFDAFLTAIKPVKATSGLPLLPDITATNLQGRPVRLSDLKGRIVVINVWGIGCGPCIAEMPELNKVVAHYKDRADVVFIGITGDKASSLLRFLKLHPYHYQVWNNAAGLAEKLNTNSLPVHIVIGRQGEVLNRSIGARADIRSFLQQVIDRNL